MPSIDPNIIQHYFDAGDTASIAKVKGQALEDLIKYLFALMPGVRFSKSNAVNFSNSEEIDLAFWNNRHPDGLPFISDILLVECKNWSAPVGSKDVDWFISKLRRRGLRFGIMIAASGITGDPVEISAANEIIRSILHEERRLVVITRSEIEQLTTTDDLIVLIQDKLCELTIFRGLP